MKDITGQQFGRLTVLKRVGTMWLCKCACGTCKRVTTGNLRSGGTKSCGCLKADNARAQCTTHGMHDHPLYDTWRNMHRRCSNKTDPNYKHYGARGITVCKRWHSLALFISDMGDRPEGTSLDRINNDKGYRPSNCRWATPQQQRNNRSDTIYITHKGVTKTLSAWAKEVGLKRATLYYRVRKGWSGDQLFQSVKH